VGLSDLALYHLAKTNLGHSNFDTGVFQGDAWIYYTCREAPLQNLVFSVQVHFSSIFYFLFGLYALSSTMLFNSLQVIVSFLFASSTLVSAVPTKKKEGAVVSGLGVPVSNPDATDVISNAYIVVYHKNCTDDMLNDHVNEVTGLMQKRKIGARSTDGRVLSNEVTPISMTGWRAMALEAEESMIIDIAGSPMVSYVEADTRVSISTLVQQTNAPLGLERISHAAVSTDGYTFDNSAGTGITVYIVDTGIRTTHTVRSYPFDRLNFLLIMQIGLWW
jgi:hypothetical protein